MEVCETENLKKIDELTGSEEYITEPTENSDKRDFYLLKDEDGILGCGYIRLFFGKIGNVGSIYIKEDSRGFGHGNFLVRKLERRLKDKGAKICVIGVHRENEEGREFWRGAGYHVLAESIGENIFEHSDVKKLLNRISPKPIPENSITLMGKKLNVEEGENTHIFKELHDLKDSLKSLDIHIFED